MTKIRHSAETDCCPEMWTIKNNQKILVEIVLLKNDELMIMEYDDNGSTTLFEDELTMSTLDRAKERLDTVFQYYKPVAGIKTAEQIERKMEEIVADKTDFVEPDSL